MGDNWDDSPIESASLRDVPAVETIKLSWLSESVVVYSSCHRIYYNPCLYEINTKFYIQ